MSWDGYFLLDGAEFINTARFEAYTHDLPSFQQAYSRAQLAQVLDETYLDPATDNAPWYDDDVPESAEFFGFYPASVDGLDNSTRSTTPTESTVDGGVPGRVRHAMNSVVFSGILGASSAGGLEYGTKWLRRTLLSALCSPQDARIQGLGAELRYLDHEPHLDDERTPQAVYDSLLMRLQKVVIGNGPTTLATKRLSCGNYMRSIQFTATIGDPFAYGADRWMFSDYDPSDADSIVWDPGVVDGSASDTRVYGEEACNEVTYQPLYDPECAIVITPPGVPNVPFGCWVPPVDGDEWQRATVILPEQNFPSWTEMVPTLVLTSTDEVRDLRIRFYRDPNELLDPDEDPCSMFSDLVVSYIPASSQMVVSAMFEQVYVTTSGGHRRRSDSLVFSTKMRPPVWPVIACGVQHLMTVESRTEVWPTINLYVTPRAV